MKHFLPPLLWLFLGALALYLIEIFAEWEPLASHDAYMETEYPDLYHDTMSFMLAEMKIDKFLLDLENR